MNKFPWYLYYFRTGAKLAGLAYAIGSLTIGSDLFIKTHYEGKTKEEVMKFWDNGLLIGEKPKIIKNIMEPGINLVYNILEKIVENKN